MTNLERITELIKANPDNIEVHYTNVNGRVRLVVNGEELPCQTYDDSRVKEYISNYKKNLELLDDCIFIDTMEEISETIDIKALDEALNQDHFTEDDAAEIIDCLEYINAVIHEKLVAHIQSSIDLLEKF